MPSTVEKRNLIEIPYSDYQWDSRGGFRQKDLTVRAVYDEAYLSTRYEDIDEAVQALSKKRAQILSAFVEGLRGKLLDFGCGTGRFVEAAFDTGWWAAGHDLVNYHNRKDPYWPFFDLGTASAHKPWDVVTFFDSLEHLVDPAETIKQLSPKWLMISVPWCHYPNDRTWFINWHHRWPGEHLWHWSSYGLDKFLEQLGYKLVMSSTFEDDYRSNPTQKDPNILSVIYKKL